MSITRSLIFSLSLSTLVGASLTPCPPGDPSSYAVPGSLWLLSQRIGNINSGGAPDQFCTYLDLNGDGLPDYICNYAYYNPSGFWVDCKYRNTGSGWALFGGAGYDPSLPT